MSCFTRISSLLVFALVSSYAWADVHALKGFCFSADYLGWKAQEDQLQYAAFLPGGAPAGLTNNQVIPLNVINQCFSFDSGVRLKVDYVWCDSWDAAIVWTHFRQNSCGAVVADAPRSVIALLFSDFSPTTSSVNFATSAISRWKLHFDTVTADFGKHYDICDRMTVDFYCGIAGARIHQKQNVVYEDLNDNKVLIQEALSDRYNNFSGVGPHAGIDVNWMVLSNLTNLAITSSLSTAFFIGKFCCRSINTLVETKRDIIFSSSKHCVRPLVDFFLGLEWQPSLCNCMDFDVHIAFETQYLPQQWQVFPAALSTIVSTVAGGDLTTYGVTVGCGVRF